MDKIEGTNGLGQGRMSRFDNKKTGNKGEGQAKENLAPLIPLITFNLMTLNHLITLK